MLDRRNRRIVRFVRTADGLQTASEWITPRLNRSEIVVVGATRAAAYEFARELPVSGGLGVHRVTLVQVAEELARPRMMEQGLGPLSQLGAEAVAARAVYRLHDAGKLKYFSPVAKLPGFAGAVASTLSDLRLAHIVPESLDTQHGVTGDGATGELRLLLAEYQRQLEERRLADLPLLLSLAAEFAQSGEHFLLGRPLLLLDVPLPSPAHVALLKALASRTDDVFAIVPESDVKRVSALEASLGCAPEAAGMQRPDNASENAPDNANALDRVVTHLFSATHPAESGYDASVDLFSAPGEAPRRRKLLGAFAAWPTMALHSTRSQFSCATWSAISRRSRRPCRAPAYRSTSAWDPHVPIRLGAHFWPF